MFRFGSSFLAVAAFFAVTPVASATLIDFDDFEGSTTTFPIASRYASLGVTFSNARFANVANFTGASGNYGVAAIISPTEEPPPTRPIIATFATPVTTASLRGLDVGQRGFRLNAYDAGHNLVDTQVVFGTGDGVGEFYDLTVHGSLISQVEFSLDHLDSSFDGILFDNLSFTPVPEPASIVALGLGALAVIRRRAKGA